MIRGQRVRLASAAALLWAPIALAASPTVAQAEGPNVSITSASDWTEMTGAGAQLHLVGEVLNSGGAAALVDVHMDLRAADGSQVGYSSVLAQAQVLGTGERSPFEDTLPLPPNFDHYVPSVTAVATPTSPAHQFTFRLDACPGIDPTSVACQSLVPQNQFSGSIRNDNTVPVENVAAIFTFLDASGKVVAENSALVGNAGTINPGSAGNFTVNRVGEPGWSSMGFMAEPEYPVDLNPSNLIFGDQLLGTTSADAAVTVFNGGTRPLTLSQVVAGGPFSQSNNCQVVAANAGCAIKVQFRPTQMGQQTGSLTIVDDAAGSPEVIPLSGTGVAPIVSLNPNGLQFPSPVGVGSTAQQQVSLTNTGTASLQINGAAASGDFSANAGACPAWLAPSTSCSVLVSFAPRQDGPRSGELAISDSAADSPQLVSLGGTGLGSGVGLSPTSVDFGGQNVGISRSRQVTVTNTGHAPLAIQTITPPTGIGESDNCIGASVAPGAQCLVTLVYAPSQPGTASGAVSLVDNAGDSPQRFSVTAIAVAPISVDPTALHFGNQVAGGISPPQTVTVTNSGSGDLAIDGVQVSGQFTAVSRCPSILAAGQACTVSLRFAPDQAGDKLGQLSISDSAAGSPQTVSLAGTGTSPRWESLGGLLPAGATVSWDGTRLDVFVRGSDQGLWHRSFDGTRWSNWDPLGGVLGSDPAAVSWGPGRIDIFVKGTDGRPWHMTFANGGFNTWQPMDGLLGSTPTVTTLASGHLDLFTRGTDAQLWHNTFDNGRWTDWQPLGGVLDSQVAAVSWAPGHIDVFTKGTDNNLWQQTYDAGHWGGWQPHYDGVLASPPAATSTELGRIDLFVRGTDARLWHKQWKDGWANWSVSDDFGGIITSMPAAVARGQGIFDVFARGSDSALWHIALGTR